MRPQPDTRPQVLPHPRPGALDVVVGLDPHSSAAALAWAAAEAARRSARLHALAVHEPAAGYSWAGASVLLDDRLGAVEQHARQNAAGLAADAQDRVADLAPGVEVHTEVARDTSAAARLVDVSAGSGLVIVGRRRERGDGPHRSTGLVVAAHAQCPVVVVPDGWAEPGPGAPVVLGLELDRRCTDAVTFAVAHAAAVGAPLHVVHCWNVDPVLERPEELPDWPQVRARMEQDVETALAPALRRWPQVAVHPSFHHHEPVGPLLRATAGARLLVVGSGGRGGFRTLLLGSTSRSVLRASTVPVAVVRQGHLPTTDGPPS